MNLGVFTVDKNDNILSMNPVVLKYAKQTQDMVGWYAEGSLKINDVVLFRKNNRITVFVYGNEDLIPLEKDLPNEATDGQILIDVVFNENRIRVIYKEVQLHVHINEQSCCFDWYQSLFLIAADDESVIYFSHKNTSEDEMKAITKGMKFSAYISEEKEIPMAYFFDEDILSAVKNLETQRVQYVCKDGRMLVLKKIEGFSFSDERQIYTIGAESDYLCEVKEDTKIYDRLYFDKDIKVNHDELSCEARLRGYDKEVSVINNKISKVCRKNVTIVLTGESGTGKTRMARLIHKNSRRANGPFVNVNCASISYNLIESELFGYEEGAFTGAKKGGKIGYFELAKGGTLFLDEISELPLKLQGKLLEVLQEGTFYRVGGIKKISADVRLIVATNRDLEKMVRENKFREDLYYRINVFPIHLPPLRERLNDLYSIIDDTLPPICERLEIEPLMLTSEALIKMQSYNWPGNIRELENVLEKAAVMADENFIREEDVVLENSIAGFVQKHSLKERMQEYEKEIITQAYEKFNGDRHQMEEYLGISKTNLFEKIHKYNLV